MIIAALSRGFRVYLTDIIKIIFTITLQRRQHLHRNFIDFLICIMKSVKKRASAFFEVLLVLV